MSAVSPHRRGAMIRVRVLPGSRRPGLRGLHGDQLKIAISQAPEKGKANRAILELLAETFGLSRSRLQLLTGETSRSKQVLVLDADAAQLSQQLQRLLEESGP